MLPEADSTRLIELLYNMLLLRLISSIQMPIFLTLSAGFRDWSVQDECAALKRFTPDTGYQPKLCYIDCLREGRAMSPGATCQGDRHLGSVLSTSLGRLSRCEDTDFKFLIPGALL